MTMTDNNFSNGLKDIPKVGVVVNNNDPKMWGRIKVRVETMFDGIPDDHLPWAIVSLAHPGGGSANTGHFEVPEVGSKVLVEFQGGSPMHPVYKGYFIDDSTILPESKVNYPNRNVTLWPSGSLMIFDKTSQDIFVRNSGDLHFFVTGDLYLKVNGNATEHVMGSRMTFVDGDDVTVVRGTKSEYAGNIVQHADGTLASEAGGNHLTYAGGSALRNAGGVIHDDSGGGPTAGSAPAAPAFPEWPGVRGPTP